MIENVVIILIVAAVVGGATLYIYRAKKSGQKCIGCPNSKNCKSCNCGCSDENK